MVSNRGIDKNYKTSILKTKRFDSLHFVFHCYFAVDRSSLTFHPSALLLPYFQNRETGQMMMSCYWSRISL